MGRLVLLSIAVASAVVMVGCGEIDASTQLRADGSFHRIVKYKFFDLGMFSMMSGKSAVANKPVVIPLSGNGILVAHNKDSDGTSELFTVQRTVARDAAPLSDVVLLGDSGKKLMTSTVAVRHIEGNRLEYTETLHWLGKKDLVDFNANGSGSWLDFRVDKAGDPTMFIQDALPLRYRTHAVVARICNQMMVQMMHLMVGPPRIWMWDAAMTGEGGIRDIKNKARNLIRNVLTDAVPEMSAEDREHTIKALMSKTDFGNLGKSQGLTGAMGTMSNTAKGNSKSSKSSTSDQASLMPLTFVVKFAGKIVETDGIVDEDSGEVYWNLYPISAALQDVKLRLVVQE